MTLRLRTRRFFCSTPGCTHRIFTERLPETTAAYLRRTLRLENALKIVALVAGGQPGARLTRDLGMEVSADTLLHRLVRAVSASTSALPVPRALGLDD